jgi:phage portal protein BeeE
VRFEQEIAMKLVSEAERETIFAEFLVDGLLRGDIKSRYEAYNIGRNGGWLSANDIRRLENMNDINSGDVYLVPLNMTPAGQAGEGANNGRA